MEIMQCTSQSDILACYPVMKQLHENLSVVEFQEISQRLLQKGCTLVCLKVDGKVIVVADFHMGESFAWETYLYIDDFITDMQYRSQGYGAKLLQWILDYADKHECRQVHLDSRVIRHATHKFYINHGFIQGGYHFHLLLKKI